MFLDAISGKESSAYTTTTDKIEQLGHSLKCACRKAPCPHVHTYADHSAKMGVVNNTLLHPLNCLPRSLGYIPKLLLLDPFLAYYCLVFDVV